MTRTQRKVLDFIIDFCIERGYSPSVREIAKGIGSASLSGTNHHIHALIAQGKLVRPTRGYRCLWPAETVTLPALPREIDLIVQNLVRTSGATREAIIIEGLRDGLGKYLERADLVRRATAEAA